MRDFINISRRVGRSPFLVQGAGGNTSFKRNGTLLVKASGVFLKDMRENHGYVGCHIAPIRRYLGAVVYSPRRESEFDSVIRRYILPEANFGEPSIETGLHAVLKSRYVIHTHNVYANVFNCMVGGEKLLKKIFPAGYFLFVPYNNPGLALARSLYQISEKRKIPLALFLKNHGLITHHDRALEALRLTEYITEQLRRYLRRAAPFRPFVVRQRRADLSRHLFPDSAVYSQIDPARLSQTKKKVFYEISSVTRYLLESINRLGGSPCFLSPRDAVIIRGMEKEKMRLRMATGSGVA